MPAPWSLSAKRCPCNERHQGHTVASAERCHDGPSNGVRDLSHILHGRGSTTSEMVGLPRSFSDHSKALAIQRLWERRSPGLCVGAGYSALAVGRLSGAPLTPSSTPPDTPTMEARGWSEAMRILDGDYFACFEPRIDRWVAWQTVGAAPHGKEIAIAPLDWFGEQRPVLAELCETPLIGASRSRLALPDKNKTRNGISGNAATSARPASHSSYPPPPPRRLRSSGIHVYS